jgi:hypothetical protein
MKGRRQEGRQEAHSGSHQEARSGHRQGGRKGCHQGGRREGRRRDRQEGCRREGPAGGHRPSPLPRVLRCGGDFGGLRSGFGQPEKRIQCLSSPKGNSVHSGPKIIENN